MSQAVNDLLKINFNKGEENRKRPTFEKNDKSFEFNNLIEKNTLKEPSASNKSSKKNPATGKHDNVKEHQNNSTETDPVTKIKPLREIDEDNADASLSGRSVPALPEPLISTNEIDDLKIQSSRNSDNLLIQYGLLEELQKEFQKDDSDELDINLAPLGLTQIIPIAQKEVLSTVRTSISDDIVGESESSDDQNLLLGTSDNPLIFSGLTNQDGFSADTTLLKDDQPTIPTMQLLEKAEETRESLANNILLQGSASHSGKMDKNSALQGNITPKAIDKTSANENILPSQIEVVNKEDISQKLILSSNSLLADDKNIGQFISGKTAKTMDSMLESSQLPGFSLKATSNAEESDSANSRNEFSSQNTMFELTENLAKNSNAESFQISFKDPAANGSNDIKNASLKPDAQISLGIKEVLSSYSSTDKKEIVINLFPHQLGAIKVEILSVLGEDNVRKIESVKIIAEKRETLDILEKNKIDLEKSLKEVTNTKEQSSLQFEMNHQNKGSSGAYFDSLKDKENWMKNFVSSAKEDLSDDLIKPETMDSGYITENSVNIKV